MASARAPLISGGMRGFSGKVSVSSASAAAGAALTSKVKEAVSGVVERPYFSPLCDARLLAVRHYDWEVLSRFGDILHVVGLVLCLCVCVRETASPLPPEGVSLKTHLLFLLVFTTRFLNVLLCDQPISLIIIKVVLWTITMKIVLILIIRGASSDWKDTMPVSLLIIPIAILTVALGTYSSQDSGLAFEILWIFSNWLEGFAMLPQYIYCYRDGSNRSKLVSAYVLSMGAYRLVFGLNWIFPLSLGEADLDLSTVVSGVLGVAFFADYCAFKAGVWSPLSRFCLSVDDDLRDAKDLALDIARGSPSVLEARALSSDARLSAETIGRPVKEVELHFMTDSAD